MFSWGEMTEGEINMREKRERRVFGGRERKCVLPNLGRKSKRKVGKKWV